MNLMATQQVEVSKRIVSEQFLDIQDSIDLRLSVVWNLQTNQSINQSVINFRVAQVIVITARTTKNVNYRRMSSGNERRNRKVFRWCWNDCRVDASTMYSGSEFQMEEVAAGKARLPTVDSLTNGTMRRLVAAERRFRRPGTSVETSRRRYENSCNYLHQ